MDDQSSAVSFYPDGTRRIRSALLVDFDNVFITLRDNISEDAALRFANEPRRWLAWLEQQRLPAPDYDKFYRRIVVKRCYLNPSSFWRFRPFFVRSGFQTVDCPPLTLQGKTSADIHIVIDAIELMEQEPRIDEFMLLSTDADYTPILRRLARADRHLMVLAVGEAAAAYKSACDLLVDQGEFVDMLLGEAVDDVEEDPAASAQRNVDSPPLPVVIESPANRSRPVLDICTSPTSSTVIGFLEKLVSTAADPLPLVGAAEALRKEYGTEVVRLWADRGLRFKDFIEDSKDHSFALSGQGPGFLYDPLRHTLAGTSVTERNEAFMKVSPDLASFARRVHEMTDIPLLSPGQYAGVFQALSDEVNANGYHFVATSKGARDRCATMSTPVARIAISLVMRLVTQVGHRFSPGAESAEVLKNEFKRALLKLCSDAGWKLEEPENQLLNSWIG